MQQLQSGKLNTRDLSKKFATRLNKGLVLKKRMKKKETRLNLSENNPYSH